MSEAKTKTKRKRQSKGKKKSNLVLTETQTVDARNVFAAFDDDGDGMLNEEELLEAAGALGAQLEQSGSREGKMFDFTTFINLLTPLIGVDSAEQQEMAMLFRLFDQDGKGFITHADLIAIAKELDEGTSERELLEMIQEADQDGTGIVDITEFTSLMKYK